MYDLDNPLKGIRLEGVDRLKYKLVNIVSDFGMKTEVKQSTSVAENVSRVLRKI
jgi:hypothetical protein